MLVSEPGIEVVGIGYEGRDLGDVLRELAESGVTTLIDVRLNPISRKRGFSKTALAMALESVGVRYEHLRVLGNPKDNRAGFGGGPDDVSRARQRYRAEIAGQAPASGRALEWIKQLAADGRVALLCFEADEHRCHRHVLLEMLRERAFAEI